MENPRPHLVPYPPPSSRPSVLPSRLAGGPPPVTRHLDWQTVGRGDRGVRGCKRIVLSN